METKPGLLTTEFWLTMLVQLLLFLQTAQVWNYLPAKWEFLAPTLQALLVAVYTWSRGKAKEGVPFNPDPSISAITGKKKYRRARRKHAAAVEPTA